MEISLISRFGWGLTVAVERPSWRCVWQSCSRKPIWSRSSSTKPGFLFGQAIQSNVRELEGGLKRVLAYSRFPGQELSIDLCREASKTWRGSESPGLVENIQRPSPTTTRSKSPRCTRRSAAATSRGRAR